MSITLAPVVANTTTAKEKSNTDHDRLALEARLEKVKYTLPLAEQLLQYDIGISEVLHS
ncbi:MAG TPA: hypothetical protein VN922_21155 [Bacteroidia bacterium]|nr:hypothetical protein [Bacteroidia bacterium]